MANIYLKDCPQCTSSNPLEAVFCRCGYCFDPNQIKNTAESLAHLAHEEEVYLDYLQARVTQAREDLDNRRVAAARDPDNTTKSAELLLATQALSTAEAECNAQLAKVQALSNHKNAVRFVRQQAKEASDKLNAKRKKRTTQNVTRRTKGKKKTTSVQKGNARATTPNQPATLKQSSSARPAVPLPKPPPVLKRPAAPAPVSAKPAPVPRPAPSIAPPSVIVRDIEVHRPSAPVRAAAAVVPHFSTNSTPQFQATQTARAREVAPPKRAALDPNSKECPHCTAILAKQVMSCRCGFNFGSVAELPALALSSSEIASILGALGNLPSSNIR
ncbi:MAG: hypothetical protein AAB252_05245 [Pseudomonadota bacterium]